MADIKVYGAPWCPDCKRSKKFLAEHRQPYEWIDIDVDHAGRRFVEVVGLKGEKRLEEVIARDRTTGAEMRWHPAAAFVFIGLTPNAEFLHGTVDLDQWGFVKTDARFETSLRGVFAAGDVRAGSTKQLGSAVGDAIAALLEVRRYLEQHHHLPEHAVNA